MDPIFGGSLLSSGTGIIGSLIQNNANRQIANANLQYMREANAQNIAFQREANAQNIAFQREINDTNYYRQLEENNLARAREDNAVQRAMADVQASGLSKTLATGMRAGSSSMNIADANATKVDAPSVNALKDEYRYQSALKDLDLVGTATSIYKTLSEAKVNEAQAGNLASSSAYNQVRADNYAKEVADKILRNEVLNKLSESQIKALSQEFGIKEHDFKMMFDVGLTSDGKAPEYIVNSNALNLENLENKIDLTKSQKFKNYVGTILSPISNILKMVMIPKYKLHYLTKP